MLGWRDTVRGQEQVGSEEKGCGGRPVLGLMRLSECEGKKSERDRRASAQRRGVDLERCGVALRAKHVWFWVREVTSLEGVDVESLRPVWAG